MYWIKSHIKGKSCNFLTEIKDSKVHVHMKLCAVEIYSSDIVCSRQEFKSVSLDHYGYMCRYIKNFNISTIHDIVQEFDLQEFIWGKSHNFQIIPSYFVN
jgi:hypothetical protein